MSDYQAGIADSQPTNTVDALPDNAADGQLSTTVAYNSHPDWINRAVFYEIYPQSFYDTNGDGIGDIQGIIAKLDYIKSLGCNALWINPWYDSPFKDAGYDVRDYKKVASRYGTNDDAKELFKQTHKRGIHVLLDLVPGHTSEEHAWFLESQHQERNEYSDRYIWTSNAFEAPRSMPFVSGESERAGAYILNFFKCQPALNYGFAKKTEHWQMSPSDEACQQTVQAIIDVMLFWLEMGCDGFRVDMANSLVKDDGDDKPATIALWQYMFGQIRPKFPQAAFVSEWGVPDQALQAGFDMDFYLNWRWNGQANGYCMLTRDTDNDVSGEGDMSYFSAAGGQSAARFLHEYVPVYERTRDKGLFCMITCNHDTPRLSPRLTKRELQVAYAMLLTMPGAPFVYYGDEIGMRFLDVKTKEGGYHRTGSRTPMQWDSELANLGFSTGSADSLYLPVDSADDAPTVTQQIDDPESLLAWVRSILHVRGVNPALQGDGLFDVLACPQDGRALAYVRTSPVDGSKVLVAVNPGLGEESVALGDVAGLVAAALSAEACGSEAISVGDIHVSGNTGLQLGPQSALILPL